ncbi:uncharacterized protein N7500_010085 [Penicillium coprophilum]|uniref:uncharacterized protein n=1 Tax=Penicillium coprophilum TaxID=36646 RepID=UPI00238F83C3|nr:uncharacterized protein N7500_010085 [Penicillium coprophilum]KAJ5154646.1 hypothetical protein N7500_010085 [Penicillium coprophilum]
MFDDSSQNPIRVLTNWQLEELTQIRLRATGRARVRRAVMADAYRIMQRLEEHLASTPTVDFGFDE